MNVTEQLAKLVVETGYASLPTEAVTQAKRAILDTLGVTLAGAAEDAGRIVATYVREMGGREEAGVVGAGFRTTSPEAALVNGTFSHALDYDDVNTSLVGHPSVPLLPAVLALGEKTGAAGKDVIAAFILGFEVECKIGRGIGRSHYAHGWHSTSTLGTMGSAAAAARLLRLDVEKTKMALGVAASMASGSRQNFGTMTKPLHAGLAARNGVVAALLAQQGFTADADILDAPLGFCRLFTQGEGDYAPERITANLGDPWDIVSPGIGVKKYPCCYATHRALDALLHLREGHRLTPAEVTQVEVRIPQGAAMPLIHSRPKTGLQGKFSMEYCLAAALLDGEVKLESFTDEAVLRPQAQQLLRKVQVVEESSEEVEALGRYATVKVVLRDGTEHVWRTDRPRGDPQLPLTWEELVAKYTDCARGVLSEEATKRSLDIVMNLEAAPNVEELMSLVCLTGVLTP